MYDSITSSHHKTYYSYSRPYWILAAIFFAVITLFSCLVLIDTSIINIIPGETEIPLWQMPFFLLGIVTSAIFTWLSYYQGRHRRLIVSAVEVCYITFGYSVCTGWENIKCVDFHPQTGFGAGFVLLNPSIKPNKRFGLLGILLSSQPSNDIFIPLFIFTKYWSGELLLKDIKLYAPHLLESFAATYWK